MKILHHIIDLIFPHLCISCHARNRIKEDVFCVSCLEKLSWTDQFEEKENAFTSRLYGRINLNHAAAVFWYSKGDIVQEMIFQLKYKKEKHLGIALGRILAHKINNAVFFNEIDVIVPIPLHPLKKKKRGYNQSYLLAHEISILLQVPIVHKTLYKKDHTESQTHKSRVDRLLDMEDSFGINSSNRFEGMNVLLVDDVLTTGATLEACARLLESAKVKSISMVAMAIGRL